MSMRGNNIYVSVADDFSRTPGARFRKDGPFSAEEFMETLVVPKFEEARRLGVKLVMDLDGVAGYATSFLQGTFGNLAAHYGTREVLNTVEVISNDDPYLLKYIDRYIKEANRVEELGVPA